MYIVNRFIMDMYTHTVDSLYKLQYMMANVIKYETKTFTMICDCPTCMY